LQQVFNRAPLLHIFPQQWTGTRLPNNSYPVFIKQRRWFFHEMPGFKIAFHTSIKYLIIKRLIDLLLGSIIFILGLPFFFIIAVLIKLDSQGPVFFIQQRLGEKGQVFNCFKFRTMVQDAGNLLQREIENNPEFKKEWSSNFKLKQDPRITRVGGFLRKSSLDELPQIINVLRSEMSLVGPRPRPLYELEGQESNYIFHNGLLVRPGITGLWQVSGRNNLDFLQRIQLDAEYVQNWSLTSDFKLLYKTVFIVLKRQGSY